MYDLLSIGDVTWDTFLDIDDATVHCNRRDRSCELCLRYGAKIPVQEFWESPGGNSANVAVGAASLGLRSGLVSSVGDDDGGEKIITSLRSRAVHTVFVQKKISALTHHSTIISFQGERTILVKKNPHNLFLPQPLPKTKWVYLSSLSQKSEPFYEKLSDLKMENGFKIAFNPNQAQLGGASMPLKKFLSSVDVLCVNREEAVLLAQRIFNFQFSIFNKFANQKFKNEIVKLLFTTYQLLSPSSLLFITDGPRGAYACGGKSAYHLGVFPAKKIADPTGAGDAFASGVLAGLMYGEEFPEVMRWGMAQSAAVLREIGAQNGLLSLTEMKQILKRVKLRPKKIV